MLEHLLYATSQAVENNRFNLHRIRELRIFRPILREEKWRRIAFAYSAIAELFREIFGGRKFGGEYG